jgi:hypothetical protein
MTMLQTETINDRVRHYSDSNMMLRQIETGALYEDAVDIAPCPYTYEETDMPIESDSLEPQTALDIIMGEG